MGGKKRSSSGNADASTFWDDAKGWKPVEVGEDFLVGNEEYGFMGLEELDASSLEIFSGTVPVEAAAATKGDAPPPKKKAKVKKTKQINGTDDDVEDLKARLAALEAENKALKKGKKGEQQEKSDGGGDDSTDTIKKKATKKTKKTQKKNGSNVAAAAAAAAGEDESGSGVDVSAWADFELDTRITAALSRMGFSAPTHVQAECIHSAVRDRRDVIGAAQTGSGKTLAFGLPILHLLCQQKQQEEEQEDDAAAATTQTTPLRALILAPTRELAIQVCEHLQAVGRQCGVWVVPIVGGISAQKQERLLSKCPEVVVATPGRLWDLMKDGHPHLANLSGLQFLVIDEADRMVQQGHYSELTSIIDTIPGARLASKKKNGGGGDEDSDDGDALLEHEKVDPDDDDDDGAAHSKKKHSQGPALQTFVFSATLTLPGEMRQRLRKGGGGASGSATLESLMDEVPFLGHGKPKVVDLTSNKRVADKITESCISCAEAERDEYLYCLLVAHPGRTIVFVNAISAVRRLAAILKILGLPVHPLHAGMQQRARLKALDRFRNDCNGILVATDVAARGLDIKNVRCVVHYQLPASLDTYVHRSGRTARAEAEGIAIALVTPKENGRYNALLHALGRKEPPEFPLDASLMAASRERVRLAVKLDAVERKDSKQRADLSWRRLNAEELGIDLSDESEDEKVVGKRVGKKARKEREEGGGGGGGGKRETEKLRAKLGALLAEPLQPKFSKKFFTGGAASGVAMQQAQQQNGSGGGGSKGKKKAPTTATTAAAATNATTTTVSKAVSMAQTLANSRKKTATSGSNSSSLGKPVKKMSRADALAAAVQKQVHKTAMKKSGKKGGLVVVAKASAVVGRNTEGPDALQALRNSRPVVKK